MALFWSVVVSVLLTILPSFAQKDDYGPGHVKAKLISSTQSIVPGKPFELGVELEMEPGWHTYSKDPGDAGMPTKVDWQLPDGFSISEFRWPKPKRMDDSGIVSFGYEDKVVLNSTVSPPDKISLSQIEIVGHLRWLACKDICVPGKADLTIVLPVGNNTQALPSKQENIFAILFFAFIGGFILNFMPCVLPVISIKVISLVKQAGEDRRRIFLLGLTFSAGIVLSFLALSGLVIIIRHAGLSVGWGFQFQHPAFVLLMSVIVFLLALSLFGMFYVNASGSQVIDRLSEKEGYVGTFFKGVLATILSTPCTAPFLGTALGFAFAQPDWITALVFFCAALGMAFPYILLTANPRWMSFIPKPGVWMEKFKEAMGFVLLATVVWLLFVLGSQLGESIVIAQLGFLLSLALATWLYSRFLDMTSSLRKRLFIWGLSASVVVCGYYLTLLPFQAELLSGKTASVQTANSTKSDTGYIPYDQNVLDKLLGEGKTVLLDFTAQWCLTCKLNEKTVIENKDVQAKFKDMNVVLMKADWTSQDDRISQKLKQFNRSGVPLYVIYPGKDPAKPIVLPEVITVDLMLEKLNQAGPSL